MATVMWSPSLMALIILIGMVVVLFLLVIIRWLLRELWKARNPNMDQQGVPGDPDDPGRRHSRVPFVGAEDLPEQDEEERAEDKPPSYDEAMRQQMERPVYYINMQFLNDNPDGNPT